MYTTAQLAAGFGVKEVTVRSWVAQGSIVPAAKANLRGDHRFTPEEVARFAREHQMIFIAPDAQRDN
jgi:DNA-binding transcriptional MerR regulator